MDGKLVIRAFGMVKPWMEIPLHFLMNPHLLLALISYAFDQAREAYRAAKREESRVRREPEY